MASIIPVLTPFTAFQTDMIVAAVLFSLDNRLLIVARIPTPISMLIKLAESSQIKTNRQRDHTLMPRAIRGWVKEESRSVWLFAKIKYFGAVYFHDPV